jgi:hypothetical protein
VAATVSAGLRRAGPAPARAGFAPDARVARVKRLAGKRPASGPALSPARRATRQR